MGTKLEEIKRTLIEIADREYISSETDGMKIKRGFSLAVSNKEMEVIKKSLECGLIGKSQYDYTLSKVIKENDMDTSMVLAESGEHNYRGKAKALCKAVECDNWDIVTRLVESGADVFNCKEVLGFAVKNNNSYMAEYLIRHGADFNAKVSIQYKNIMNYFICHGKKEMVEYLLCHGYKLDKTKQSMSEALNMAVEIGDTGLLSDLMENFDSEEYYEEMYETAIKTGRLNMVVFLTENRARKKIDEQRMVSLAAQYYQSDIVDYLIQKKKFSKVPDANDKKYGWEIYFMELVERAMKENKEEILKMLVTWGLEEQDRYGKDKLMYEIREQISSGDMDVIKLLIDSGLKPDEMVKTRWLQEILRYGVREGDADFYQFLIAAGIHKEKRYGKRYFLKYLKDAIREGNLEVVDILICAEVHRTIKEDGMIIGDLLCAFASKSPYPQKMIEYFEEKGLVDFEELKKRALESYLESLNGKFAHKHSMDSLFES